MIERPMTMQSQQVNVSALPASIRRDGASAGSAYVRPSAPTFGRAPRRNLDAKRLASHLKPNRGASL